MNTEDLSYVPGKPHPNSIEYFALVDENSFTLHILWEKSHQNEKYSRPKKMFDLIERIVNILEKYKRPNSDIQEPFVLYIDSRFSSIDALRMIHEKGLYAVMSCSSGSKPKDLWTHLKKNLEKREWNIVYLNDLNSIAVCVRPKHKTFLNLLSNYCDATPVIVQNQKRRWPKGTYETNTPYIQKEYNSFKNRVDLVNKMVLQYHDHHNTMDTNIAYFQFFLQMFTLNSFIWWKTKWNKEQDQLEFRLQVLDALYIRLKGDKIEKPKPIQNHWPVPILKGTPKCQNGECGNKARKECKACEKVYCGKCINLVHEFLLK